MASMRGPGLREIYVRPERTSLFNVSGKVGLDPTNENDLNQIKAVAQGYASGAYDDAQMDDFLSKNPAAGVFIAPVIQQARTRNAESSKYFNPGSPAVTPFEGEFAGKGALIPQEAVAPKRDIQGAITSALARGDVDYATKLQGLAKPGESPFAKIDPKDYTSESVKRFSVTGDPSVLVPRTKPEDLDAKDNKVFQQEEKLRGEYRGLSKDFLQVRDSYGRIQESAKDPSAAGDLALIFNYMKMLDPGSTVREGEFATAQNSAGIPDRVRAMYNKSISGERLADTTRSDFLKRSEALYKRQLNTQKKNEAQYRQLSKRYGVNADRVVTNFDLEDMPAEAPRPESSKVIGGKTYVKINGKWFEQ